MRPEYWIPIAFLFGYFIGRTTGHTEGFKKACTKFEGLVENQAKEVQKVKEAHVTVNQRFDQLEPRKNEKFS